jgi:hypothetical protein
MGLVVSARLGADALAELVAALVRFIRAANAARERLRLARFFQDARLPSEGGGFFPGSRLPSEGGGFFPGSRLPSEGGGFSPGSRLPSQGGGLVPGSRLPSQGGGFFPGGGRFTPNPIRFFPTTPPRFSPDAGRFFPAGSQTRFFPDQGGPKMLTTNARRAAQAVDAMTQSLERLANIPIRSSAQEQDLADLIKRGQRPELITVLKKALGL